MAKMRGVIEAPGKCDVGNRPFAPARICHVDPAMLQTPRADAVTQRASNGGEQTMQMADRDAYGGGDLIGAQCGVRNMRVDESLNPRMNLGTAARGNRPAADAT